MPSKEREGSNVSEGSNVREGSNVSEPNENTSNNKVNLEADDFKDIIEITITKVMETSSGPIMYYAVNISNYYYYFSEMSAIFDNINKFKRQREMLYRKKCKIEISYNEYYEPLWPTDYLNKKVKLNVSKFGVDKYNSLM